MEDGGYGGRGGGHETEVATAVVVVIELTQFSTSASLDPEDVAGRTEADVDLFPLRPSRPF